MTEKIPAKERSNTIPLGEFLDSKTVSLNLTRLLRSHLLLQAASGGGKSWALRRLAEQTFGHVPTIIIDPEGEFSSLREKYDFLLIGPGGETPADVRTAGLLAHKLRELRVSAICDLFEMEDEDRHIWLRDFLLGMLNTPRNLWGDVLIMIDEAQLFAPEKGEEPSPASRAMKRAAMLGRKRGMGLVIATNRIGITDKTVIAQCQNLVIGRTRLDIDQERSARAFGLRRKARDTFVEEIKRLTPGWAFAQGPAISEDRSLIHFGSVHTTHPEPGDPRHLAEPPPTPRDIRHLLPQLADLPREAEEEAQKTIRRHPGQKTTVLHHQAPAATPTIVEKHIHVLDMNLVEALTASVASLRPLVNRTGQIAGTLAYRLDKIERALERADTVSTQDSPSEQRVSTSEQQPFLPGQNDHQLTHANTEPITGPIRILDTISPSSSPRDSTRSSSFNQTPPIIIHDPQTGQPTKLVLGERMILAQLAARHPKGYTKTQLATLAGYNPGGGGFNNAIGHLRRLRFIERDNENHVLTEAGKVLFPQRPVTPSSQEVIELWCGKLTGRARDMLRYLYEIRETTNPYVTVDALAHRVKMDRHGGGFNNYMGDLRSNGLIKKGPGGYRISEIFSP